MARLIVFDVDGTLIKESSIWRFIHEQLGTLDACEVNKRMYEQGLIDYREWAILDAMAWKGVTEKKLKEIISKVEYVGGVKETFETLKRNGFKIAIISAGLTLITDRIKEELGVDYALSNELVFKDGKLTGEVKVSVEYPGKEKAFKRLVKRLGLNPYNCIAVGDTNADLYKCCKLKIAFNPKEEVDADVVIQGDDLREILKYVLGFENEFKA
ncbi:phosphoserine phosphatase [archaeon]|nr:MAG: phosphoserine phosphatase [archaeon]RLG64131.1 MAG: phosphoserine phosphatase [archaeon]RLG66577.1 MAG: phosphoserine phosphatase [archaeon]HDM23754.1 HAD family hydrolase [Candidatus Bathyarchaeota archaeon]